MKIACFFTAGYTELRSMKLFMSKINSNAEYVQLCPNSRRKSKDAIKNRKVDKRKSNNTEFLVQSGYTGDKLIEYVLKFVATNTFRSGQYDAIIIEDDKDDRFLQIQDNGMSKADTIAWEKYQKEVADKINLLYPDMPVIFFLAAPEIEMWFYADWDNGFGNMFSEELSLSENKSYSLLFKKYIETYLLKEYVKSIEEYGYISGQYYKFSEQVQDELKMGKFWDEFKGQTENHGLKYSKKYHGSNALGNIEPNIVKEKCNLFFRDAFYDLKEL